jgi:hypothetical protein
MMKRLLMAMIVLGCLGWAAEAQAECRARTPLGNRATVIRQGKPLRKLGSRFWNHAPTIRHRGER